MFQLRAIYDVVEPPNYDINWHVYINTLKKRKCTKITPIIKPFTTISGH